MNNFILKIFDNFKYIFYNKNVCSIYNAKKYAKEILTCTLIVKMQSKRTGG